MNCTYCRMREEVYKCTSCGARVRDEDRLVVHTPQMKELDIPARKLFKCPYCRGKLEKI